MSVLSRDKKEAVVGSYQRADMWTSPPPVVQSPWYPRAPRSDPVEAEIDPNGLYVRVATVPLVRRAARRSPRPLVITLSVPAASRAPSGPRDHRDVPAATGSVPRSAYFNAVPADTASRS